MLFSIPWTHHKFILDKIKGDVQKGLFFVAKAKKVYFWRATFLCWFGVLQPPAAMLCTHWPKDGQIDTSRFGANADVRELLWQAYVYAAAYQLYLPDKALLQAKVKEWIEEFEENCLLKVDSKLNSLAKLQGQKLTILSTIRIWLLMFLARMVKFRFLLPAVLHHALYQKRWLSLKSAWILSKSWWNNVWNEQKVAHNIAYPSIKVEERKCSAKNAHFLFFFFYFVVK